MLLINVINQFMRCFRFEFQKTSEFRHWHWGAVVWPWHPASLYIHISSLEANYVLYSIIKNCSQYITTLTYRFMFLVSKIWHFKKSVMGKKNIKIVNCLYLWVSQYSFWELIFVSLDAVIKVWRLAKVLGCL